MTDQHAHAGYVGHDGYLSGSSGPTATAAPSHTTGGYDADPLFGAMQGGYAGQNGYAAGQAGQAGQFDTGTFDTGTFASSYDTTGQWTVPAPGDGVRTGRHDRHVRHRHVTPGLPHRHPPHERLQHHPLDPALPDRPSTPAPSTPARSRPAPYDTGQFDTGSFDTTGQWDANAWTRAQDTGQYDTSVFSSAHDTTGQWAMPGTTPTPGPTTRPRGTPRRPAAASVGAAPRPPPPTHSALSLNSRTRPQSSRRRNSRRRSPPWGMTRRATLPAPCPTSAELPDVVVPGSRAEARRAGSRRRRTPAKRSALLTVAVPSVCVMGVAGVAVGLGGRARRRQGRGGRRDGRVRPRLGQAGRRQQEPRHPARQPQRRRQQLRRSGQPDAGTYRPQGPPGRGEEEKGGGGRREGGRAPQVRPAGDAEGAQRVLRAGRRQLDVGAHRHRLPGLDAGPP